MSDYFDRVERQLVRSVEAGVPRSRRSPVRLEQLGFAAAVLVVFAVVAVFLGLHDHRHSGAPARSRHAGIVFSAVPIGPGARLGPSIERSTVILRRRIDAVFPGVRVARAGDEIVVADPRARDLARIVALSVPGQLYFYDWEADALLTSGHDRGATVASRLPAQDPVAVLTSQGTATLPPGSPGDGSLELYQAVELAHRQPAARRAADQSHAGAAYYLFGGSRTAACRLAARRMGEMPSLTAAGHCLLAGPQTSIEGLRADLHLTFGAGVTLAQGRLLTVPRGTVVVQAADPNASAPVAVSSPLAQFYVLKDRVALGPGAITGARQSTDTSGAPDVEFAFTSAGESEFSRVTEQVAHRGFFVSSRGQTFDQHFAIVLDGKLMSVPSIDFHEYPEGVRGGPGADIASGLSTAAARDLATVLRFGPLPVKLALR
ncbi:MAG TPA: hypothetical protein VIJ20_08540 [Solirubrobacteraceae bacterium]